MELSEFVCTFQYYGKKYNATGQRFKVQKFPQYRIVYWNPDTKTEDVYIFYEINDSKQKFFTFSQGKNKDLVAQAILRALKKSTKL